MAKENQETELLLLSRLETSFKIGLTLMQFNIDSELTRARKVQLKVQLENDKNDSAQYKMH